LNCPLLTPYAAAQMETAVIPGLSRLDEGRKADEPCTIVIFGVSGDLTVRKLIPPVLHLFKDGQMPEPFRVVGFARREKTDASWL
jgi:glucose-6-phosphate 1-dehydrogenase